MEKLRTRCVEKRFENGQDDIIGLPSLAKDIISSREREKLQGTRVLPPSSEHIARNLNSDGKEVCECLECILLMSGKDVLHMKCGDHPKNIETTKISERRQLLNNIGEKTGKIQLNVLKAHLLNIRMMEDDLDNMDVWKCLDFLENNLEDGDLFPLLKIVYKKDSQLEKLLNEFMNGDTQGLTDKFPTQEVGDQNQTLQNPHTDLKGELLLHSYDPRFSDSITMIPDGLKMGSTKPEPSQLLVYDRGKHPDLLVETLKKYGYEVFVYNDKSCSEIFQTLEKFQSRYMYYSDYGAFIVLTLSHGEQDVVFGSCGQTIVISSMTSLFRADNCPSLAGKPKIFIYQACQGRVLQEVWQRAVGPIQVSGDTLLKCASPEIASKFPDFDQLLLAPVEADFIIVHSTMPGFVSLRNKNGSFFIQSLVKKIEEHSPREDLVSILAEVNRDVSQKIGVTSDDQLASQIPESKIRLTRKFYLQPVR